MIIKSHLHKKGFTLGLVLKQRFAASRKWPIDLQFYSVKAPIMEQIITSQSRTAVIIFLVFQA